MRQTVILLLVAVGQNALSKPVVPPKPPVVTSVEPQGVRSGGSFVVQVDLQESTFPFKLVVFRDDIDSFRKHASDVLTDNDAKDEARQTGLVKYRIKTDDTWLTRVGGSSNDQRQEVRYRVVLQAASFVEWNSFQPGTKPGTKPLPNPIIQPTQVADVITVFARPEFNEELVVAGDIDGLLQLAVTLRLGASDDAITSFAWASGKSVNAGGTVDYSADWFKKYEFATSASKLGTTPQGERYYSLFVDPKAWPEVSEACASIDPAKCPSTAHVPRATLEKQARQLESAVKQLEDTLSPNQQKQYAMHLKLIKAQLDAVNKAIKGPIK